MALHPVFESVRQHLQQGETGAALQTMITYLEADGTQTELLHTLRVIQANFNAAKQQELKGILAFQEAQREYSKVNDAILTVVDDLSAGRSTQTALPPAPARNYQPWIIGGAALLVVAIVAVFLLRDKGNPAQAQNPDMKCPDFRPSNYHIMLLPFVALSDASAKPEVSIQGRIRDLTRNNQMPTDVEIATEHNLGILPDFFKAAQKGKSCSADLVVWGQYEKVGDSILVDVHYVFSSQPKLSGHTAFHPFRSLSAIQNSGNSSGLRNLDDAILSVCSIMAIHAGKVDVAEKWLSKIQKTTEKDDSLAQAIAVLQDSIRNQNMPLKRLKERQNKKK